MMTGAARCGGPTRSGFLQPAACLRSIWAIWGHQLTAEQAAAIGPVDAVLVPVGGVYTVDAAGAKAVCDALHPRCVVPMHYHHAPYGLTEVDSVEPFLELWPAEAVHHLQGAAFELTEQTAGVMVPSF